MWMDWRWTVLGQVILLCFFFLAPTQVWCLLSLMSWNSWQVWVHTSLCYSWSYHQCLHASVSWTCESLWCVFFCGWFDQRCVLRPSRGLTLCFQPWFFCCNTLNNRHSVIDSGDGRGSRVSCRLCGSSNSRGWIPHNILQPVWAAPCRPPLSLFLSHMALVFTLTVTKEQ